MKIHRQAPQGARLGALTLLALSAACAAPGAGSALAPERRTLPNAMDDTVRAVLNAALDNAAFPGAVAVIGNTAGVYASVSVGVVDAADDRVPGEDTIWDIASLTKVVGLTSALMQLNARGAILLDAPAVRYLPQWTAAGADGVTVRQLLSHSAGLPPFRRLWLDARNAEEARALLYAAEPERRPGERVVYSDIGAFLLGEIVESVSGSTLDVYLRRELFMPLGMHETMFRPAPEFTARIAPTELDPWRQRHLRGEVHDENAHLLGGVAGHAGLFSTAQDLTRFARMMLGGGRLDGVRVLDERAILAFTAVHDPALSSRALGWDTADGTNSGGQCLSPRAYGHTGFTGTSLWLDPDRDLFVMLLSNRVNPTRHNTHIGAVRLALVAAVCATLDQYTPTATPRPITVSGSPP